MTVTAASFRGHFPEFTSVTDYPNATVDYWISIAALLANTARWGNFLDVATELFVAHNLVLEARAVREANAGGIPGQSVGIVNSKSVDKVSYGVDTNAAIEIGAGHWNMTVYGIRFIRYAKMFGAGGIQVGIGPVDPLSGAAWSGPYPYPTPSN